MAVGDIPTRSRHARVSEGAGVVTHRELEPELVPASRRPGFTEAHAWNRVVAG